MGNTQSAASPGETRKSRRLSKAAPVRIITSNLDDDELCTGLSETAASRRLTASYLRAPLDGHLPKVNALPPMFDPKEPYLRQPRPESRSTEVGTPEFFRLQDHRDQRPYTVYEPAATAPGFYDGDFDGAWHGSRLNRTMSWNNLLDQRGQDMPASGYAMAPESPAVQGRVLEPSPELLPPMDRFPDFNLDLIEADLSLFTTIRRRSQIMIPGVATRPEPEQAMYPEPTRPKSKGSSKHKLPTRPRSRTEGYADSKNSPPSTPRRSSTCSEIDHSRFLAYKRASTPNNVDYQQLGGHKFGTLRIMNASPAPSSARPSMDQAVADGTARRGADGTGPGTLFGVDFSFKESEMVHLQLAQLSSQSPHAKLRVTNSAEEAEQPVRKISRRLSSSLNRLSLFLGGLTHDSGASDDGTLDTPCSSRRKSLNKPDSGYGSQISLRDLNDGQQDSNRLLPSVSLRRLSLSRRARTSSNPPDPIDAAVVGPKMRKASTQLSRNRSLKENSDLLSKRPSFSALAEAAHAAFASKLRHRKSIAGHGLREESKRYP